MMAIPKTFAAGERLFAADLNGNFEHFEDASAITAGTLAAAHLPAGTIKQVVSTSSNSTQSISGTTFTNLTGLEVAITPQTATSKILLIAHINGSHDTDTTGAMYLRFTRGGSAIAVGAAAGSRTLVTSIANPADNDVGQNASLTFLDSPASTSEQTYRVQGSTWSGGVMFMNRSQADTDNAFYWRGISTLTAIEVTA
jgi:hypothetical protein